MSTCYWISSLHCSVTGGELKTSQTGERVVIYVATSRCQELSTVGEFIWCIQHSHGHRSRCCHCRGHYRWKISAMSTDYKAMLRCLSRRHHHHLYSLVVSCIWWLRFFYQVQHFIAADDVPCRLLFHFISQSVVRLRFSSLGSNFSLLESC